MVTTNDDVIFGPVPRWDGPEYIRNIEFRALQSENGSCVVRYGEPCRREPRDVLCRDGALRCGPHARAFETAAALRDADDAERVRVARELAHCFIRIGDEGPLRCVLDEPGMAP
jgi:hypothetical protein